MLWGCWAAHDPRESGEERFGVCGWCRSRRTGAGRLLQAGTCLTLVGSRSRAREARTYTRDVTIACADCGCLVERGVRVSTCAIDGCCCSELPTRQSLDDIAAQVTAAFEARDLVSFGALLADDARWGDDDAPNKCRSRRDVVGTFERLLASGVSGAVTETRTGPAGILCHLRVHWPDPTDPVRRDEVLHLYRVRGGQIVAIEPFDDRLAAEAALASS